MKKLNAWILTTLLALTSVSANAQTASFEETLTQTLEAFSNVDTNKLQSLIHPSTGLYVALIPGTPRYYSHYETTDEFYNWWHSYSNRSLSEDPPTLCFEKQGCRLSDMTLQQGVPDYFVGFFCSDESEPRHLVEQAQSKRLIFIEDAGVAKEMSHHLEDMRAQYLMDEWDNPPSLELIQKIHDLEKNSKRVVSYSFYDFYLTHIDGKWYLTVIGILNPCDA